MIGMDDQEILAALDFGVPDIYCDSDTSLYPAPRTHSVASWFVMMHECKPPGATVPAPHRVGDVALCAKCAGDIASAFTAADREREKYRIHRERHQLPESEDFGVTCGICDRKFKRLSEYMTVVKAIVQPGSGHE